MDGTNFNSSNGGSLTFDGSNEYVDADTLTAFGDNDPITVEAWINADSLTNLYQVIATVKATTNHWQLSYSGDPTYNLFFTFTGNQIIGTSTLPPTGKWHHIVVTYNGGSKTDISSYKIYSSALQQNISLKGISGAANNKTIIGFRDGGQGSNYFDGKIAQVKIYNKALSPTEVKQNYQALLPRFAVTDGLVLNLDAGNRKSYPATGTTWTDLTGNGNDGTLTNGPTFDSSNGGSIVFDGTDEFVSVPDNSTWDLPGDFSLQVWFKRNAAFASTWWRDSFIGHDDGGGLNNKWIFTYDGTSLLFHTNTTSGSSQLIQAPIPWTPSNNEWYLVNLTKSGNVYTFYQNSISLGSVTNTAPIPDSSAPLTIGTAEGGSLFNGNIAKVKIYNKALTAAEVEQNFNVTRGRFGV